MTTAIRTLDLFPPTLSPAPGLKVTMICKNFNFQHVSVHSWHRIVTARLIVKQLNVYV